MINYKKSLFIALFIIVGFIGINILSRNIIFRKDLTQNGLYSLAPATIKTLRSLDDVVSVKCFFSSNLPPAYQPFVRQIKDLLKEYQNIAGKMLDVEFVDPKKDSASKQLAEAAQIPEIQLNIVQNDRKETIKGFFGITIYYGNKKTTIPVVTDLSNLEYEITSGIVRVFTKGLPNISFALFGNRKTNKVIRKYTSLFEYLGKQAIIKNVYVDTESIPEKTDLLFVIASDNATKESILKIKKYINDGGKAIILDQIATPGEEMRKILSKRTLKPVYEMLGVKVSDYLIYDKSCNKTWFSDSRTRFPISYALFPRVIPYYFNRSLAIFNGLSFLSFPLIGEITVTGNYKKNAVPLFYSSTEWGVFKGTNLAPTEKFEFKNKKKTKKALAYLIDKRITIIPNSLFISDDFLPGHKANLIFILNIIDWMTMSDSLSDIRQKSITRRGLFPVEKIKVLKGEDRQMRISWLKKYITYINVFGPSIIIILLGLLLSIYRRNKRLKYEDKLKD